MSLQMCKINCIFRVVCCWMALVLDRLTLMVTLTLVYSWVLRPSLQKLPAPPQPHTSQRSVNWQTSQWIRWSFCFLQKLLLFFMSFYFIAPSASQRGISKIRLYLFYLSLLAIFLFLCVWRYYALQHQTVKGGISETRIEKRIVISGDADIDHDQVSYSFCVL